MKELMYDINTIGIAGILFVSMVVAIEAGYRIGLRFQESADDAAKSHITAIQASLLGILALLLGFTFSLSLQRFDSRSEAVVDEANAIGTAYLRAQLLSDSVRGNVQELLRDYLDQRVRAGTISLAEQAERDVFVARANRIQTALWSYARQAAKEDPNPVTAGLFIQALNELIDAFGKRDAALHRHVPEVVLLLLFGTFLMAGAILGYASGVSGHRTSFVTYVMVVLIVVLVFIILDLDRPRRGLIEVSQKSLIELQAAFNRDANAGAQQSLPTDIPRPAGAGRR